jgi:glutamine synthetase
MTSKTVTVEYVWIGGSTDNWSLRSKTRVFQNASEEFYRFFLSKDVSKIPSWNYDGSSTGQADGRKSEVTIKPVSIFLHPFSETGGFIVMCDTYDQDGNPLENNHRLSAKAIFDTNLSAKPWFGMEQEYFLINPLTGKPFGFDTYGVVVEPPSQGQYYCSVGHGNAFGRKVAERHLSACITAGINISGINAEVAPGQWEFQVGPCEGIQAGDHLWIARYLLLLVAENYNIAIDFEPKPLLGDWNGSGCHVNYSTKSMRESEKGLDEIYEAIEKLSQKHSEHMAVYGKGNENRMTGAHETARYDEFNSGVGNRGASVRIGQEVVKNGKGYFEDRRPSSNCDPYLVTSKMFVTTQ